jgi:ABC-type bacteriocin/lantibiotic exporter with double-glycine peptidase domain
LILDEATNAIDYETENNIIKALRELSKSLTIIVVSHKPSAIAFCDDAIVLNRGRVVETGPLSSTFFYRAMQAGNPDLAMADSLEQDQTCA